MGNVGKAPPSGSCPRALRWVEAGTAPCASCGPTLFTLVFVCLLFSLLVTGKLGNHREKHSAVTTLP